MTPLYVRELSAALAASALLACGGSDGYGGSTAPQIAVAGSYATVVSLTANTCGSGITVQNMNTVVTHVAGATTFGMQHGVTYFGHLSANGHFTTDNTVFVDPAGTSTSTLKVTGDFSTTGFIADVTVSVVRDTPPNCAYSVHWVGSRQGSANVIP